MINNIFKNKKAYIGYLTAGQNGLNFTKDAAIALIKGGVDILEIGVPFSDPVADGAVIQEAMNDALDRNTTLDLVLELIADLKSQYGVPIVLFSYYNPIYSMGLDDFFKKAKLLNLDAVLIVDLPFEESGYFSYLCRKNNIAQINLIAPSTNSDRLELINKNSSGFLYYVSRNGTTGIKGQLPNDYSKKIKNITNCISLPIVTGFGIGDKNQAKQALLYSDGFVVGSAFVKAISNGASKSQLVDLVKSIDPR